MSKLLERRVLSDSMFRRVNGTLGLEIFLEASGYCDSNAAKIYAANIIDHICFDAMANTEESVKLLKQWLHKGSVDFDGVMAFVECGLYSPTKCTSRHVALLRHQACENSLHPHKIIDLLLDAPDAVKWRDQIDLANTHRLEVPNTQ